MLNSGTFMCVQYCQQAKMETGRQKVYCFILKHSSTPPTNFFFLFRVCRQENYFSSEDVVGCVVLCIRLSEGEISGGKLMVLCLAFMYDAVVVCLQGKQGQVEYVLVLSVFWHTISSCVFYWQYFVWMNFFRNVFKI